MPKAKTDKFANMINKRITMSGVDTITFEEINIGLNIFDKVGLLINRIEFLPAGSTLDEFQAQADYAAIAVTASNQIASISFADNPVIDAIILDFLEIGANGVSADIKMRPFTRDYSTFPGGGLLVAPRPLYIAMDTVGFAAVGVCDVRIYFTVEKLADSDYFELLESRQFFG
jgi:hypothetical protein